MEFKPLPMPQKQNVEKSYIAILKMKKRFYIWDPRQISPKI